MAQEALIHSCATPVQMIQNTSPATKEGNVRPCDEAPVHSENEAQGTPELPPLMASDGMDPPETRATSFLASITQPLPSVEAPTVATPAPRSSSYKTKENTTLVRRSRRIALSGNNRPSLERAQCMLMRKLGLILEQESISHEARDAYTLKVA